MEGEPIMSERNYWIGWVELMEDCKKAEKYIKNFEDQSDCDEVKKSLIKNHEALKKLSKY
jgi:ribosome-binding factor A